MAFEVATARVDITPPPGMNPYMAGYGVQTEARTVVDDARHREPLYARCVLLWSDGQPHAVVSLDILGLPREVHGNIRRRLLPLARWESPHVVLVSSHTHNGPVIGSALDPYIAYDIVDHDDVRRYTAWLEDRVVETVRTALAAARTGVTLEYRTTSANFSRNRAGLPYTETTVPVLTARAGDGRPRAVLFSYGCHPVSAGWQQAWDGDWPAAACTAIEERTGAFPLFLPGPAGDQDPAGVRGFPLRDAHGEALGNSVSAAVDAPGRVLSGPVVSSFREMELPLDITPTAANLAAVRAAFTTRMSNPLGQPAVYQRHAEAMIARIDAGDISVSVPMPSQVWRFGGVPPLKMAFLGGELVSGYAAYFRARHGGPAGLYIGGYANEVCCYVPSDELLPPIAPWDSYEGGWTADYPGIAGGSMTIYPQLGHFRAGPAGAEATLIAAVTAQLG